MSDENDKPGLELDLDDDLNWDDALREWEAELERDTTLRESENDGASASASEAQKPPPVVAPAPPRPLYRPPSEELPLDGEPTTAGESPIEGRASSPGEISIFDDDEDAPTKLSDPPTELDATLRDAEGTENTKPTSPPPGGIELDLDSLLDGLDDTTTASGAGSEALSEDPFGGLIPVDEEQPTRIGPGPDLTKLTEPLLPDPAGEPKRPAVPSPWAGPQRTQPGIGLMPPVPPPARADGRGPIYKPPPPPPGGVLPKARRPLGGPKRPARTEGVEEHDELTPVANLANLSPLDRPTPVVNLPPEPPVPEPSRVAKPPAVPPPLKKGPPPLKKKPPPPPVAEEPILAEADDDEPILAEVDDDEPDLSFEETDGAELDMIGGDDGEHPYLDDDGLDEMTQLGVAPELGDRPATPSVIPEQDAGARTAARTVRYRKPREEDFPLVGPDALRARRELLVSLAATSKGSTRARLLVATAEICEQLGESNQASELYHEAHDADPSDLTALRARRRTAIASGSWAEAAELLEAEGKLPLSPDERAAALTLLAEVQLTGLGDADSAMKSARTALGLKRTSPSAAMLLADAAFRAGRDAEAFAAIERAVEAWPDGRAKGALLSIVGHGAERMGRNDKAHEAYTAAIEADPGAVDVVLGLARSERANGNLDGAVVASARLGERLKDDPVGDAFRRAAARAVHLGAGRPADGAALLFDARSVPALRARATAALDAEDAEATMQFVEAWAAAAGGTERALALVTLAELRADAGDLDAADAALRDAAVADSTLAIVRVSRELFARRAGDTARLARALGGGMAGGTAIVAAAKLARAPNALAEEQAALREAQDEEDGSVAADVVSLDVAATTAHDDGILMGLRRQIERSTGEQRVGALMALAREARRRGNDVVAETILREARETVPADTTVLRALASVLESRSASEAAVVWLEEASAATGERAAFAATFAGRLMEMARAPSKPAYEQALENRAGLRAGGVVARADGSCDGLHRCARRE